MALRDEAESIQEAAHARGLRDGRARSKAALLREAQKRSSLGLRYKAAVGLIKRLVKAVDANDYEGWMAEGPAADELDAALEVARKRHHID